MEEGKMSLNKFRTLFLGGLLAFATAPLGFAQHSTGASQGNVTGDMRQAQQELTDLGYNPGSINGMMSSHTRQAIREFQWLNGLPVTGKLDQQTKIAIDSQYRGGTQSSQMREKPTANQGNITELDDVRQAQQALTDLGYNPGDINGMMSSDTQQAIREFQWFNGLPVTGNLDQATTTAINSQYRK
jgi:peptidoglycan hydrolase-like protein with peptidoglycan-binding domain